MPHPRITIPVCRGAFVPAEIRQRARQLRKAATPAERKAWEILRDRRCFGLKFRRQQPLGTFIVDFYCVDLDLAIEIDGDVHDEHATHDRSRDILLGLSGTSVIRVRNDDVSKERLETLVQPFLHADPSPRTR